jgi:DNA repair exonuclease SbcCD ATPase subunit
MLKITNITLKNFLSTGAVTQAVNLDKNGLTLVLGHNTDTNGGITKNGAGKTTLAQAISYGIFGKPISKIKIPNLINNINGKNMLVTIDIEKDGVKYRIERGKKPDVLKFYVNNKEQKYAVDQNDALGENRHTQAEINKVFGMSSAMFQHIVAMTTYTEPFLRMKVSDQREIIEELLGVTQISTRAAALKILRDNTKDLIRDEESMIKAHTEANTRIETAIGAAIAQAESWQRSHDRTLATLADEIATMRDIDYDSEIIKFDALELWSGQEREYRVSMDESEREISHLRREMVSLQSDISRYTKEASADASSQVARLKSEIKRTRDSITNIEHSISHEQSKLAKVESDLANPDAHSCLSCGQGLKDTKHLEDMLERLRTQQTKHNTEITKLQDTIVALEKSIDAVQTEIETLQSEVGKRQTEAAEKAAVKEAALEKLVLALSTHQESLENYRVLSHDHQASKPETLFNSKDEVYRAKQLFDALVKELEVEGQKGNPFNTQADTLRGTLQEIDYAKINDYTSLFQHQDFLWKLLTSKDSFIRKKIIDQNLSYLNQRVNHYLDKLGLPHEVKFQSDLSVDITMLGRDFDFEQLSRGEMNRVIMATSWSFRDVWESLNDTVNLFFVDELIDNGLDQYGVESALAVLKSLARDRGKNVFLISHREELIGRIDRIMLVKKENGFTRLEDDASI